MKALNVNDTEFTFEYVPIKKTKPVRFHVEVIYQSDSVERYRLTAGEKIMILQKTIAHQHSFKNWRLLDLNFIMENINEWTVANLFYIYDLINYRRFGKRLSTYYRKTALPGE